MGEGLSLDQITFEMLHISAGAIRRKQWIVVTGWSRWMLGRWMLGRWNPRYLAAPKDILGRSKRGCKNRLATHKGG